MDPFHGRECMYADICKYCGRNGRCPGSGVSVEKEKRRRGRRHWKRSCKTGGAREERLSKTAWPRERQRVTRGSFISWPQIWRPDRRQKLFFLSSSWERLRERLSHVQRQEHSWILSWRTSATYCVLFDVALNDEPRRGRKKWGARRTCQK